MVVKRVVEKRERERERETVQQRRDYSTCVMIYSYLMVITKSYVRFGVEKEIVPGFCRRADLLAYVKVVVNMK